MSMQLKNEIEFRLMSINWVIQLVIYDEFILKSIKGTYFVVKS